MPAPGDTEITSQFIYATCREGSERALKAEIAAEHGPSLHPAFMRPQFITWKVTRPVKAGFALKSIFARVSGISLGTFKTTAELVDYAKEHLKGVPFHLHVFPREVPEDGVPPETWERLDALRQSLLTDLAAAGLKLHDSGSPQRNHWVLDVIVMEEGADSPLFLGLHRHTLHSHAAPGGLPRLTLPAAAPSRTWLKMEQALIWAGWDAPGTLKGKGVLELGSAPGGASYSLLQRGAHVVGVDTGEMADTVLDFSGPGRFTHLKTSAGDLGEMPLPAGIKLLVVDMNVAPPQALRMIERIQRRLHVPALMLTLKINNAAIEQKIDRFIETVRTFAPTPIRATQLAANRAEICVVAGKL
jgi:23S rRNA (cytidine2498-2'-O)-methyltransferase